MLAIAKVYTSFQNWTQKGTLKILFVWPFSGTVLKGNVLTMLYMLFIWLFGIVCYKFGKTLY